MVSVLQTRAVKLQWPTLMHIVKIYYTSLARRSSSRLYNVVCSPELWRRLLSGIEEFSEAKVDGFLGFFKAMPVAPGRSETR